MMSYKKIFWGVILITIGTLFILKNLDILYFSWSSVWRLWPVLLILWGISVFPMKNWLRLVLSVITIVITFTFASNRQAFRHEFRMHRFFDETEWEDQHIKVPYDSLISEATFQLDAAAGSFKINSSTDQLIEFNKRGNLGNYSLTTKDDEGKKIIKVKLENTIVNLGKKSDRVNIQLNPEPLWDLDLDIGAASFNLDLTEFKVANLDIDGGAASVKIKLGQMHDLTKLTIDAGASSIRVSIPENSGCEIKTSTVLSSRSFQGFEKIKQHTYQTSNFGESENKIYIELDAAVSSMNIIRY